jgi:pantoate--beta-alanine ligase
MFLVKNEAHLRQWLVNRKDQPSIGFVPTMGALHEGHLSLIRKSNEENDLTVCSIYVNPTQFNDPGDLEKYPRPIEKDIALLMEERCDLLFLPLTEEIYPGGTSQLIKFALAPLDTMLEGASRPGHFQGVANVVWRLLQMVQPSRLYLGQKDFQQVKVIEKLVSGSGRPEIVMCPILREESGLAMSSRNIRLTDVQRKNAAGISRELFYIRDHGKEFELPVLKQKAILRINSIPEAQVDYFEFCDADNFRIIGDWKEAKNIICVTSVMVGGVRLLDNVTVNVA